MWLWQGVDGEALGYVALHPLGELRGALRVVGDPLLEAGLRAGPVRAVEDRADIRSDDEAQVETRDVGLGVLLEVELAALPWDGAVAREAEPVISQIKL